MSKNSANVVEASAETFEQDVIKRSREVPVVVDFWAEWCQPCRMLGPVLESLAEEYGGRFVLVKVDTEVLGDYAAAFGVRGIPAVYGLKDGRVVDSFVGVISEREIRTFLERLLPNELERKVAEARALEGEKPEEAELVYRAVLEADGNQAAARVGLARVLLAQGKLEECRGVVEAMERRGFLEPEEERIKAELTLKVGNEGGQGVGALREAVAREPGNRELRLQLAESLAAEGRESEALEMALELVESDRKGTGEEARKLMLAIFQLLPEDSELGHEYRRRLSLVL